MKYNPDYALDEEEQDILEHFERGNLRTTTNTAQEMELAREAAANTISGWREVTLRVTEREYELAHARAAAEGIPCPAGWLKRTSKLHKFGCRGRHKACLNGG